MYETNLRRRDNVRPLPTRLITEPHLLFAVLRRSFDETMHLLTDFSLVV